MAGADRLDPAPAAVVLVPVKSRRSAKGRLDPALAPEARVALARAMAERVLDAAAPLGVVVVCDDEEVAGWARARGAAVAWTPGLDLNGALEHAVARAAGAGIGRVVIAHADLPFAHDLARFAEAPDGSPLGPDRVVVVPDRHGEGTNVMSLPTGTAMALCYGPGSLERHLAAATAADLVVTVAHDPALAWDVDEPADLTPPADLGALPGSHEAVRP